jgi:hypothetical protein
MVTAVVELRSVFMVRMVMAQVMYTQKQKIGHPLGKNMDVLSIYATIAVIIPKPNVTKTHRELIFQVERSISHGRYDRTIHHKVM